MKLKFKIELEESENDEVSLTISKPENEVLKSLLNWINEFIKIDIKETDDKWTLSGDEFKKNAIVLSILTSIHAEIIDIFMYSEQGISLNDSPPVLYDTNNNPLLRPTGTKERKNKLKIQRPMESLKKQENLKT
jgi:hypothetical protein